jgi:hypothetical protein
MGYPALIVGQNTRFAVHLATIGSFKPLRNGIVDVVLERPGGTQVFTTPSPSRPGIFGVDVKPVRAGS